MLATMRIATPFRTRGAGLLALALCVGFPPGCDEGGEVDEQPHVAFLSPEDGATVCGDPFEAEIELRGFELIEEVVTDPENLPDGKGHAHFYLNGQSVYESAATAATFDEPVSDGAYQLKVELANANHSPVEPYVSDLIYITVDSAACEGASE